MLRLSWFELIVRCIPEELLFVLAVHTFSKIRINVKKYLTSSLLLWIIVFLVRSLPIQMGVNTILSLIALIVLASSINKIDIIKSIRAGIITTILAFILEGVNVSLIQYIFKINFSDLANNHILKTLYGLPSLIIFGIIVVAYYLRLSKRKELNYICYGKTNE